MKFTDFFWDFDGTLFDTYPRINRAIQNSLKDLGLDVPLETIEPLSKVSIPHAGRTLVPDRLEAFRALYHQHAEEEGFESMQPYAGAAEILRAVCARGGRNYLYTMRGHSALCALKHDGLAQYFTDFITGEEGFPGKPAPDALLHLIDKHRLDAAACVMVGDRDIDLKSGFGAGMAGALFDPGHYYDQLDTPYRYETLFGMMADLVWDGRAEDLQISDMLALQRALQDMHPEWGGNIPQLGRRQLLWLVGELGEVIDVVKKVRPEQLTTPGLARSRLVEELADVAMYFHDVLSCYGISAAEFSQAYYDKMQRNLHRDYAGDNKKRYGG